MINGYHKIRPAGRHILTIGRDLIQDPYAAIVELVKNSYDADATEVSIGFSNINNEKIQVTVTDDGHGMSSDTVINKWMVPSTNDKQSRKISPSGRVMQGRKGIGRYASSVLGDELLLETVSENKKTSLFVDWGLFEKAEFLDDIEILIEAKEVRANAGTKLIITGNKQNLSEWKKEQFDKLNSELKKLKSPITDDSTNDDIFDIYLSICGFSEELDRKVKIEPYPLFELYDYRISGIVKADGKGTLTYALQKARNTTTEIINFDFGKKTQCGSVEFDIRVYDREPIAIDSLIKRGLKDENGNYVRKLEARQLLDKNNGVGVYRNGFRIRPLGDSDYDWLKLNEERIQNPSKKIGSNQVIGTVKIESEEISNLKEKSARDGLIDNESYSNLILLTQNVISKLEEKRFLYRKQAGLSRPILKIETEFEKLFSFDLLKADVQKKLKTGNVDANTTASVLTVIDESEREKNKLIQSIKETVAIYQGQATLGKIINVILHEGRKPLSFFKNQIPILNYYYEQYSNGNVESLPEIAKKMQDFSFNSNIIVQLFSKIDPLAAGKRGTKKSINIKEELLSEWSIFEKDNPSISYIINDDLDTGSSLICWKQDVYSVFTNLIENSLFWMNEKNSKIKNIEITIHTEDNEIQYIDYKDTGPGIEPSHIETGIIFEPEFSTKPNGTGLGLSIAGEAARRMGFNLKALLSDNGAYFRLEKRGV